MVFFMPASLADALKSTTHPGKVRETFLWFKSRKSWKEKLRKAQAGKAMPAVYASLREKL